MNTRNHAHNNLARWLPVGAAGVLLLAVIVAGVIGGSGGSDAAASTTVGATGPQVSGPFTTETYQGVETIPTSAPIVKVPLAQTLSEGMAGDDVLRVQKRLKDLAFDPGPVDGSFGTLTKQAVWAFEKLVLNTPRAQATGRVTPEVWDRMQDPIQVAPRRSMSGLADHTEIYLPQQVMVIFHADVPVLVAHVSSGQLNPDGTPFEYSEDVTIDTDSTGALLPEPITKPVRGLAKTPPGVFTVDRKVPGTRNGPLGSMWDPIYINQGIAIHGANNVPLEPASHGCIRVSRYLGSMLQGLIDIDEKVYIWDGKKEPEDQTAKDRQMIWDWVDISRTTTTSSTTTTTLPIATTVPPTTLKPGATTTSPQTTTPPVTTTVAPGTTTTLVPVDGL